MKINATFQVLRLHKCDSAVALNKTIKLSSEKSRYGNSSTVIIRDKLEEINKFVNCTILIPKEGINNCETKRIWLAKCSPYMEHTCKNWYGFLTEIWAATLENDFDFFPLEEIQYRVVFVKTTVNFWRYIGENSVLIVSRVPIYSNINSEL